MGGIAERVIKQVVDELCTRDDHWAPLLFKTAKQLREKSYYATWYVDILFQKFGRFPADIYDAYCFLQVHSMIQCGDLMSVYVDVGKEPEADKNIEYNDGVLKNLSYPFSGTFYGGLGDQDGRLSWLGDIKVNRTNHTTDLTDEEVEQCNKQCSHVQVVDFNGHADQSAPLEVGYTQAWTTLLHLKRSGSLARWPYGSTKIWLLVMTHEAWKKQFDSDDIKTRKLK